MRHTHTKNARLDGAVHKHDGGKWKYYYPPVASLIPCAVLAGTMHFPFRFSGRDPPTSPSPSRPSLSLSLSLCPLNHHKKQQQSRFTARIYHIVVVISPGREQHVPYTMPQITIMRNSNCAHVIEVYDPLLWREPLVAGSIIKLPQFVILCSSFQTLYAGAGESVSPSLGHHVTCIVWYR